jgi:transcription elongation GreA/GreB family factor
MEKQAIVTAFIDRLRDELETLWRAARATYEGAIHPESTAEDEYDTRGLEQSYLAGAQAARVRELRWTLDALRAMPVAELGPEDDVRPGALVELEDEDGGRSWVLLAPVGGGASVSLDGRTIRCVTPESPLGSELLGREQGDDFELELPGGTRSYEIVSVR